MRIVLTSHGSTGDIYPVIGLAVALRRRGHRVRFATIPHYQPEIEAAGVEFYPLCPNWEQPDLAYWMGRLNKLRNPVHQLREIYVGARAYIPEMIARMDAIMPETDLLVSSYLFPMNRGIADRHGVPFATLAFAPHVIPSPDYAPENLPSPRWLGTCTRRAWNRWLWKTANAVVDRTINASVADALRRAALPKVRHFFSRPAELVLVTVPETIFRVPGAEIESRFHYTGYLRWQAAENAALEDEVRAFVADAPGGKVPIITFGSMVYDNAGTWMERFIRAWPRGRKVVIQRGWAQFPQFGDAEHIKVVGKVSHDRLFHYASAVAHHGGAGTTASALHAGVPQVIVPHIGDQFYFGAQMERIGVGLRLKKAVWPEQLHLTFDRLLADPNRVSNAGRIAAELRVENGPECAADLLERFVARQRRGASAETP